MSKHSSPALTMRDALYEAPGPKMRAKIRIGTAIYGERDYSKKG